MGIYISSKGIEHNTSEMPLPYLLNALSKAENNKDQETIDILEEEIDSRNTIDEELL